LSFYRKEFPGKNGSQQPDFSLSKPFPACRFPWSTKNMKSALSKCPVCDGELVATRLHCDTCDTTIEGRFANGSFAGLTTEQLDFVETFVRVEGRMNRMSEEMGVSYPTLRNRLQEIIRALGYEPGKDEPAEIPDEKRISVLEQLDTGSISAEEAMRLLNGEE
jgi:hypothetical protein